MSGQMGSFRSTAELVAEIDTVMLELQSARHQLVMARQVESELMALVDSLKAERDALREAQ